MEAKRQIYGVGGITLTNNAIVNIDSDANPAIHAVNNGITIDGSTVTTISNIFAVHGDLIIRNHSKVKVTGVDYYSLYSYDNVSISDSEVEFTNEIHSDQKNVTINGSVVRATGNGSGQIYAVYGNITLGWSNPSDLIYAKSYRTSDGSVTIAAGKTFIDECGNTYSGTMDKVNDAYAINGKTLRPYSSNSDVSNSLLVLADNANNTAVINTFNGQTYNVTLVGRTLYKDGAWNTLCLPFSLTEEQIAASSLADADIRTLSGTNFSEGTLTLAFTPKAPAEGTVTSITAGTPYIIKWAKADGYDQADPATRDIKNPEFTSVTISNTSADVETTYMDFKGTYDRTNIYTDKKTNLYLGADDTLYYPWAEGMSSFNINAFRAYFQLKNGLTAGDPALSRFMLNFGDGEASGISLTPDLSPKGKGSIYTIDGRKVNGQHAKKGLYIHNGRKVVVK